HYYNPFRGGPVVDDTAMAKSRWKYGSKANFNLIDAKAPGFMQRRKPLSGVGRDDVLVIDGHGADRVDVIGIEEGTRNTARLTAERLAQQLEQEGLRKDPRVIRPIACYAGGSPLTPDPQGSFVPMLKRNRTVTDRGAPFAMRLA